MGENYFLRATVFVDSAKKTKQWCNLKKAQLYTLGILFLSQVFRSIS